ETRLRFGGRRIQAADRGPRPRPARRRVPGGVDAGRAVRGPAPRGQLAGHQLLGQPLPRLPRPAAGPGTGAVLNPAARARRTGAAGATPVTGERPPGGYGRQLPATCRVAAFRRFQTLMLAIVRSSPASCFSS